MKFFIIKCKWLSEKALFLFSYIFEINLSYMVNTNTFQCFCFWGSFGLENNNVSHFQHKKCIPTQDNYIFLLGELT